MIRFAYQKGRNEPVLPPFRRQLSDTLASRMREPRRFIQVVEGPRQTGKTTAVRQALASLEIPSKLVRASQDIPASRDWLHREWDEARTEAANGPFILAIDEIQLVSQWSSTVKQLWDADTDDGKDLRIILTGSSSLLLQHGLRETLTGRFEVLPCQQWELAECEEAFGFTLDDFLFFGGYPGAAPLRSDEGRWLAYMRDSIIAPSVLRDVIALDRITKPALMEALFALGCAYSGQEVSYRKLLGQLDDAGNATTIAHYLTLLGDAGLLSGLQKYTGKQLKSRASSPRLIAHDTSLMTATYGPKRALLLSDPALRGHLVESAVGAYLLKRAAADHFKVHWWRDGAKEVDFVLESGAALTAIEVKSGRIKGLGGLDAFHQRNPEAQSIIVGSDAAPLDAFLRGEVPLF